MHLVVPQFCRHSISSWLAMADLRQRYAKTTALPDARSPGDQKDAHASRRGRRHTAGNIPRAGLLVVAFLIFHAVVFATVAHFHAWLPPPQPLDAPSSTFSEARARVVLEKIMSFGYRPVGSKANDELTPAFLLSEVLCLTYSEWTGDLDSIVFIQYEWLRRLRRSKQQLHRACPSKWTSRSPLVRERQSRPTTPHSNLDAGLSMVDHRCIWS
jgi:hypothetical protein